MPHESAVACIFPENITMENLHSQEVMDAFTTPNGHSLPLFTNDIGDNTDSEITSSQKSNASSISFNVRKLMMRLGSQGSNVDSENEFDLSQGSQASLTDLDSLLKIDKDRVFLPGEDDDYAVGSFTVPQSTHVPRCRTPCEAIQPPRTYSPADGLPVTVGDLNSKLNPVTPTKPPDSVEGGTSDPWTPTANLKMLISAASPEIRNRDRLKKMYNRRETNNDEETDEEDEYVPVVELPLNKTASRHSRSSKSRNPTNNNPEPVQCTTPSEASEIMMEGDFDIVEGEDLSAGPSRKEKSLGLLCHRFISRYPEYPETHDHIEICLDGVAQVLGVERRRIYDIVNVLESVEIVSRIAKNKYAWHGKTNLQHTLAKLKALAAVEGFVDQIRRIKDFETMGLELENSISDTSSSSSSSSNASSAVSPRKKTPLSSSNEPNLQGLMSWKDNRKDKSLGIMSQRFLMLFLISAPKTVNLDMSAKILIGDPNIDKTESSKFKTKIRRLYDIANILSSLGLIRKVQVTEIRGRKPAFKYVGPVIEDIKNIADCSHDGCHRPSSKHSLLDCIQNPQVCQMLNVRKSFKPQTGIQLLLNKSKSFSATAGNSAPAPPAKKQFSRHASFDQICEVAEQERKRLYFESHSQPSSPGKRSSSLGLKGRQSVVMKLNMDSSVKSPSSAALSEGGGIRTSVSIAPAKQSGVKSVMSSPAPSKPVPESFNALANEIVLGEDGHLVLRNNGRMTRDSDRSASALVKTERIRVKTVPVSGQNAGGGKVKTPTVVTLTKSQLDALLHQLAKAPRKDAESETPDHSPALPSELVSLFDTTRQSARLKAVAPRETAVVQVFTISQSAQGKKLSQETQSVLLHGGRQVKRLVETVDCVSDVPEAKKIKLEHTAVRVKEDEQARLKEVSQIQTKMEPEEVVFTKQSITPPRIVSLQSDTKLEFDSPSNGLGSFSFESRLPSFGLESSPSSPLPHGDFNLRSSPPSQLNTPTFPARSHDTTTSGGQATVFQFPPAAAAASHASPSCVSSHSLPNTPTFRLSSTSSPVLFLPARPSSLDGNFPTNQNASPVLAQSDMAPPLKLLAPPTFSRADILHPQLGCTPFAHLSGPSVSTPLVMPSQQYCTPTGTRSLKGIPASSGVINLVPLFSSASNVIPVTSVSPGGLLHPMTLTSQEQPALTNDLQLSWTLPQILTTPLQQQQPHHSPLVQLTPTQVLVGAGVSGLHKTPQSQIIPNMILSPSQTVTPTMGMVLTGRSLATPGTFFRGTPVGPAPDPRVTVGDGNLGGGVGSAFQIVGGKIVPQQSLEGATMVSLPPVRRLHLAQAEELNSMPQ